MLMPRIDPMGASTFNFQISCRGAVAPRLRGALVPRGTGGERRHAEPRMRKVATRRAGVGYALTIPPVLGGIEGGHRDEKRLSCLWKSQRIWRACVCSKSAKRQTREVGSATHEGQHAKATLVVATMHVWGGPLWIAVADRRVPLVLPAA